MILDTNKMKTYSDQEILDAMADSIEIRDAAIRKLYLDTNFRGKAFGVIRKIISQELRSDDNAIFDVFDEGLMEFIRLVGNGKFQGKSSIHTYIIGICKFKCLEYNRRFARQSISSIPLEDDSGISMEIKSSIENVEEDFIKMESGLEAIIQQVIQKVSSRCQEILRRYLFEEQSVKKMANEMGTSIQTIKNARSKCRIQLRELIKNHPQTPEYIKTMA